MKYFIITVDTEGDDLWHYKKGESVKTENSLYLPKFQELCEKYGFKPVWLTNYEMACDQRYVDYIRPKMEKGLCEVGIHVHAWNNPPLFDLNGAYTGNPYLIEYPSDVMRAKFKTTYDLIQNQFGISPFSHRSGRWAMNEEYFQILKEFGVLVDCSYTPCVDWSRNPGETIPSGSDYSKVCRDAHFVGDVLEVPMSIYKTRLSKRGTWKHKLKTLIKQEPIWLRPASSSVDEMKAVCDRLGDSEYLEFMLHSSELMPGGSPYFKTEESISRLYSDMETIFDYVRSKGYVGITLKDYYAIKKK